MTLAPLGEKVIVAKTSLCQRVSAYVFDSSSTFEYDHATASVPCHPYLGPGIFSP
jgi:hypothetical protein